MIIKGRCGHEPAKFWIFRLSAGRGRRLPASAAALAERVSAGGQLGILRTGDAVDAAGHDCHCRVHLPVRTRHDRAGRRPQNGVPAHWRCGVAGDPGVL